MTAPLSPSTSLPPPCLPPPVCAQEGGKYTSGRINTKNTAGFYPGMQARPLQLSSGIHIQHAWLRVGCGCDVVRRGAAQQRQQCEGRSSSSSSSSRSSSNAKDAAGTLGGAGARVGMEHEQGRAGASSTAACRPPAELTAADTQPSHSLTTAGPRCPPLQLKDGTAFTSVHIEARAQLPPPGKGLWPAFWLFPTGLKYGKWAASGEVGGSPQGCGVQAGWGEPCYVWYTLSCPCQLHFLHARLSATDKHALLLPAD